MSKQMYRSMNQMQVSAPQCAETASSCPSAQSKMGGYSALAIFVDTTVVVSIFVTLLVLNILGALIILSGLVVLAIVAVLLINNSNIKHPNEQPCPT